MPTHKKGRDRDKYYHLAKDQGYRSRAAFKLIQINKRFDFLSKSRVLIDLCAAPGGWCQVASKFMPVGSIVIGVDLLPIRAIRNVKTLVADITTAECRKMIVSELQGWKADVVLCDGAPDIGGAYSKDAYVQNELVLAALKTACDHLVKGGTFCTKVYRSVDYNSLIWVFQQLFEEVQAIKPSSSRSQSSEIFIVCLKYTSPKQIDPKLLDPNHVFKEVSDGNKAVDVLHRKSGEHNKRNRSGYDESLGILLRKKLSVSDFIEVQDPVRSLTDFDELFFSERCESYKKSDQTTEEITNYINDLRILSKSEFKKILKWRQQLKDSIQNVKTHESADTIEKVVKDQSTISIDEELGAIQENLIQRDRRLEKKNRRLAAKDRKRKELGILNNAFEESGNDDLFSITAASTASKLEGVDFDEIEITDSSDEIVDEDGRIVIGDEDLDMQLEEDYVRYLTRLNTRENKTPKKNKKSSLSSEYFSDINDVDNDLEIQQDVEKTDLIGNSLSNTNNSHDQTWYSHPLFKETLVREEDTESINTDIEIDMPKTDKELRRDKRLKTMERNERRKLKRAKIAGDDELDMKDFEIVGNKNINDDDEDKLELENDKPITLKELEFRNKIKLGMGKHDENSSSPFEIVPSSIPLERFDERKYDSESEDFDDDDKIATLALGTLMLDKSRKKSIIDSSYNRYSWNDTKDLPKWFLDDDYKHNKPQLPIPSGLIQNIKKGFQDVGTKEIKKVAEARMRKRKRALTKLKAAKKKATSMAESSEMSGRQKVKAIAQAMKDAKISKPGKVYVVARKTKGGSTGNVIGSGKGRLKFVDKRMRKDLRGEKNKKKKSRKR